MAIEQRARIPDELIEGFKTIPPPTIGHARQRGFMDSEIKPLYRLGEVIVGLLELDRNSYLNADRDWKPTLPQRDGKVTGDFRMVDFLTFAGVAPTPARGG